MRPVEGSPTAHLVLGDPDRLNLRGHAEPAFGATTEKTTVEMDWTRGAAAPRG
jgi:hypothetical protein